MPRRVVIRKWSPPKGPMTLIMSYAVPDPAKLAEIMVVKLQAQLLGGGCQCFTTEELVGNLKTLGCEVEIEKVSEGEETRESNKRQHVN